MNRRTFLGVGGGLALTVGCSQREVTIAMDPPPAARAAYDADVVVIGGGVGGCAAALAALRQGMKVVITEETDWIGGQLTAQAVPPDEHEFIESPHGGCKTFHALREAVRQHYRDHYPIKDAAKKNPKLNPGAGWVSRLCAEPVVWHKILCEWFAPFVAKEQVVILLEAVPVAAEVDGDKVKAVRVKSKDGRGITLTGKFFLDATEQGDLLPLAKCEFVTGAESRKDTGEPSASAEADPLAIQSFTHCFAMEHRPGENHVIDKPANYAFWRDYSPPHYKDPKRKLFTFDHPNVAGGKPYTFDPAGDQKKGPEDGPNFWTYRRVLDKNLFNGTFAGDISVINWHLNDYTLGAIHGVDAVEEAKHRAAAREMSLALVYWLQTETPRPDGKTGWPELRMCGAAVGTADGFAKSVYIRESRRIKAEFTLLEQHIAASHRDKLAKAAGTKPEAEPFPDSVGIGHYLYMDLHACAYNKPAGGGSRIYPYRIPLGALLPQRLENLLPACKNLGTTHLTNGALRMHPAEWNIGESAALLAAFCVRKGEAPRRVRKEKDLLADYQKLLRSEGTPLEWNL